jgi:hypothetical protein
MSRAHPNALLAIATASAVLALAPSVAPVLAQSSSPGIPSSAPEAPGIPAFDPNMFVPGTPIDNAYFPLPVGRTIVYKVRKDGQPLRDTVTVTDQTKMIAGVTATVVTDVAEHNGKVEEQTTDWYAQDTLGNVWYLGEDTVAYDPNGTPDTSGSWEAGVNGERPGIIMEAHPQVPDAYRQEYLASEAEDAAWVVDTDGTVKVPYGTVTHVLTTLEASRVEPGVYSKKVYGPGIGIVLETSVAGEHETSKLVSVTDR